MKVYNAGKLEEVTLDDLSPEEIAACTGDASCPNHYTGGDRCCIVSELLADGDKHAASHRDCDHCGKEYPESSLWRDAVGVACDACHSAHVA